ncbi:MAG: phage holin family protein [Betaproteobacteria bacterium]|nr:phage holin family protein [Betaproteobacteria bacterium]
MYLGLPSFLLRWAVTTLSLWVTSAILPGISFSGVQILFLSALLLSLVNMVIRPLAILLTLPLTILTFGLFLLVINALMLLLVARIVPGFHVENFVTALIASLVIAVFNLLLGLAAGL